MQPPVSPGDFDDVDQVLVTHAHTDHLDPPTISAIAGSSRTARFVVPSAAKSVALERGVPAERMVLMRAGERWEPGRVAGESLPPTGDGGAAPGPARPSISAIPSAHEKLETDDEGNHRYLGYLIDYGWVRVFHSGDCVPYDGLSEGLKALHPDIALLPVNGRDTYRSQRGVPGNFTAEEAIEIARASGAAWLVGHHFGMFSFNTADEQQLLHLFQRQSAPHCVVPRIGDLYRFTSTDIRR
jgi:L-ascorbate metabolism protein UlaG (beta-lactamase superfamily)